MEESSAESASLGTPNTALSRVDSARTNRDHVKAVATNSPSNFQPVRATREVGTSGKEASRSAPGLIGTTVANFYYIRLPGSLVGFQIPSEAVKVAARNVARHLNHRPLARS